ALAVGGFGELRNRPIQPALLFRAVSNADLHLRTAAEKIARRLPRLLDPLLPKEDVIRPGDAGDDEQDDEQLAEQCEFGTVRRWRHEPLISEECWNVAEHIDDVLR